MTNPEGRSGTRLPPRLRHDLLTPVNAIIGYSELLLEDVPATPARPPDELEKIRAAARMLAALIGGNTVDDDLEGEAGPPPAGNAMPDYPTARRIAAVPPAANRKEPDLKAGSFLIADDNEWNRDMLLRQLERQGYQATTAVNGREALDLLRTRQFDLLLLDIVMPEMDGYELLRYLKAQPDLRDIPVIMISALDDLDSIVRCIELGAEDYLPKPFDPVLLRARIGASLDKKRHRDQELDYLRGVSRLTAAASAIEAGTFDPAELTDAGTRPDELGKLARVFTSMAQEVYSREQRLRQQMQELRIEIDEVRKAGQVAEITETEYFRGLQEKAQRLRASRNG